MLQLKLDTIILHNYLFQVKPEMNAP